MGDSATSSAGLIDGRTARPGDFPAVMGLAVRSPEGELEVFCSATLLAHDTAVTAAHCLAQKEPRSLAVIATNEEGVTSTTAVASVRVHPRSDPDRADFDLAVLNLATSIDDIQPAFLAPSQTRVFNSDAVTLIGYGATSTTGEGKGVKSFGQSRVQQVIGDVFLLGGGGAAPCFADAGGAVMLVGGAGERLLAVISHPADPSRTCKGGTFAARANMGWAVPPPRGAIQRNPDFGSCAAVSGAGIFDLTFALAAVLIVRRVLRPR